MENEVKIPEWILENLCWYDQRNPDYKYRIDSKPNEASSGICYCDNCWYGRTKLANELVATIQTLNFVRTYKTWDKAIYIDEVNKLKGEIAALQESAKEKYNKAMEFWETSGSFCNIDDLIKIASGYEGNS